MRNIATTIQGFTPLIDEVVRELGLTQAAVYGVVWRFTRRDQGICRASVQTIADQIGLSPRTVSRHLASLVEAGYLEDTTPDLRNRPHIYLDTSRVTLQGEIRALSTMTESHSETAENGPETGVGMTESHSRYDTVSYPGMTESHMKILHEDTTTTNKMPTPQDVQPPADGRAHFLALAHVCVVDLAVATTEQKRQVAQSAAILKKAGVDPEQIDAFGPWWYETDWRGKQGQAPTPAQVRAEWGKYTREAATQAVVRLGI